jgi:hypothetical protein
MTSPEDLKPLADADFRAKRAYLADHVFAIAPEPDVPPQDPLVQEQWEHLMDLPTDVALRTTDHLGTMIDDMLTQHYAWMGALPPDPSDAPMMFDAALEASDEFDASPFIAVHGYYRQATASLRNALELMAHGARFAVCADQLGYDRWQDGSAEPPKFGNSLDILFRQPQVAAIDQAVGTPGLFGSKPPGVLRSIYRNLCQYTHSQPGYTNFDVWQSNGPVFSGRAFTQFWKDFCDTLAACYILFKVGYPSLELPDEMDSVYPTTGPTWHGLGEAAMRQVFSRSSREGTEDA